MKIETRVIHGGLEPDNSTGAVMTPIYQTSTYIQERPGVHRGFTYSRTHNPTRSALENNLAQLEGGAHGLVFSSGLSAIESVIKLLNPGDEVLSSMDLYGGTHRLFTQIWERYGIFFRFVDLDDLDGLEEQVNANTKMVWLETPTNPMMNVFDIAGICRWAKNHNLLTAVDNTFATPYLQNPLSMGADMVMHSVTKYLSGHSDVIMGALITDNPQIAEKLYFIQKSSGAVPGPQDCFLVLRGIKTLAVRMDRHCANAERVAEYLCNHKAVKNVYWPGLADHPKRDLIRAQMRNFGGMISFTLADDRLEAAFDFVSATRVFTLAESLGGVESLIGHPATMTHASIPREERIQNGILDSTIRLSVGIEHIDDLLEDLEQAFNTIQK